MPDPQDQPDESVSDEPRPEQPPMTDADGLPHNTDTEDER